ncbi:MAG: hypothetical protein CHKLHMKO_00658 [Candidatus Argoarchaeum ethanivorans]|uniref:Glycosyltransferase 2-like domain-containing protein n=1 Tax=Candidatus Argoarchaeum ethanivorans TaxID=2608793 RepID=A0A811T9T5_9EURY|nr:MAG: hypothetical protein CHKLHMKO_00658 [Candidatus Argoarchaeum ethanivorans]
MSNMSQITDHTLLPAGRAVVVSHGVNKGKGSAVRTSLEYAAEHGFDALVLLDGDGQHDPGEIPGLLGHWCARDVYGADAECDFEVEGAGGRG